MMTQSRPIRVGLDSALSPWAQEVKYVFRTLFSVAGFCHEFIWVDQPFQQQQLDIYYGRQIEGINASISILSCGRAFSDATSVEPRRVVELDNLSFLDFSNESPRPPFVPCNGSLRFFNDIIFVSYWLLTGAREKYYSRDRWDNLNLEGFGFLESGLLRLPLVSFYGSLLRKHFTAMGHVPLALPWTSGQKQAAFCFSHDVDYPQIIRTIECLRLLKKRGLSSLPSIKGVLNGTNHFWKFADWVDFEKGLGTRPAFFFMARKGSLFQYAMGTPDGFYDIRARQFVELFQYLKDEGCEIGLHASYNAYRDLEHLRREKTTLEEVAGVVVEGNRHHYWHLDPTAPHETLRLHEQAGLVYDSSLAFELYPGFRRGICHPFRPFDPVERRELNVLELPPAWMDDHFDRRLQQNRIADPEQYALDLLNLARETQGIIIVDYHQRGMNSDFYPRYGPWLTKFMQENIGSSVSFYSPGELARMYLNYDRKLLAGSRELTEPCVTIELRAEAEPMDREFEFEPGVEPNGCGDLPLVVDLLKAEEESKWDAFVAAHRDGTIYHTTLWKKVTEEGLFHRAYYLRALDSSGQYAGVLPLFLVQGLWGRRLVSVPLRDRGGVLSRDPQTASLLVSKAIQLTKEFNCKYLELRSLEEMTPMVLSENNLHCETHWITTRLDLSPGTDRLWESLDKKGVRWAIKNGRKKGVRLETNSTIEGMGIFYDLFSRTRRALGIPAFSKSLFSAIWRHLILNGKAQLLLAWKGSDPIGGMITFLYKDTAIYAYGAPQKEWNDHHPSDLLVWHSIESAARQGFRVFDFGADSPRQTGLLRFKEKWGAVRQQIFSYYVLNGAKQLPTFDSSSPGYAVLRRSWKLLPQPISRFIGGRVARHLG